MQIRKNRQLVVIVFSFLSLSFAFGCKENPKRIFFDEMKLRYDDLKIDSISYFIKNFGLEKYGEPVNNNTYWKLNCEKGSFFYLAGYLRLLNDSIMFTPTYEDKSLGLEEKKLFDFSATDSCWSLLLERKGNMLYGDSIVFLGKHNSSEGSIYSFSMYPFYFFKKSGSVSYLDYWFNVDVSKHKGILNITALGSNSSDTLFYCSLIPKEMLIDKRNGKLRL